MEDTHDTDVRVFEAVDDDVCADQVGAVRLWQVGARVANPRVVTDRLQGLVDRLAVGLQLVRPPLLTRVAQDVDEILAGPP